MKRPEPSFAEVVEARLKELNTNAFAISQSTGLSYDKLRNALRPDDRRADPKFETAREIARAIGLELYLGPARDVGVIDLFTADQLKEYVHVPLHETLLATGAGSNNGEAIIDRLAFRRDWLSRLNLAPSSARLARVSGDSMTPSIWPGDMVMIDTSRRIPPVLKRSAQDKRRSPIYAFAEGTDARIKRIERPAEDQLLLLSDNPDYAPELRTGAELEGLQVIGKVVWWGHTVKE